MRNELRGRALTDFVAGEVAYRDGDYKGALLKFTAAHHRSQNPRLLFTIATCEKALRHYAEVTHLLKRYLREAAPLPPAHRGRVEALLEVVASYIAEVTITSIPEGAEVRIDGELVGVTPLPEPVLLSHGERRLQLSKAGFEASTQTLQVAGGSAANAHVVLVPVAASVASQQFQAHPPTGAGLASQDTPEDAGLPAWLWIGGGVALATLAGTLAFLILRPSPDPVPGTLDPGVVELSWRTP